MAEAGSPGHRVLHQGPPPEKPRDQHLRRHHQGPTLPPRLRRLLHLPRLRNAAADHVLRHGHRQQPRLVPMHRALHLQLLQFRRHSVFIPKFSSSAKIVGCKNPKCKWVFENVQCRECDGNSTTCNQFFPTYVLQYGSGSTTGILLSESLVFPDKSLDNFVVGCSFASIRKPAGIAGFGRGPESLPAQMGLKMFSYCLISHRFDGNPVSSDLILENGAAAAPRGGGIKYIPFRKNPASSNPAFREYYYVTLRKITVGGVKVKAPYKYLVADSDGNGGTIVDSGTTFTFMESEVFEMVAEEFEKQVGKNYGRAAAVEEESDNISGEKTIELPQLTFQFKGGAKMALPLSDYLSFLDESVICMTVVSRNSSEGGVGPGPAIILGNYQQQNFYMEYDLENERLGFRSQLCK